MIINNPEEFVREITKKMQIALDNTMEKALDKLVEIIQEEVYDSYSPTFYERTHQFRDSWENTKSTIKDKMVEADIWQRFEVMVWDSVKFQHGNNVEPLNEGALSKIINEGLIGDAFGFPQLGKRPFWDSFMDWVEDDLPKVFAEECRKQGLDMRNINLSY